MIDKAITESNIGRKVVNVPGFGKGGAAGSNYRGTFFAANPKLEGKVVVHHAVEQQTLKRLPGRFTPDEIHDLSNLRGIPKGASPRLHLSQIRREWNDFYRKTPSPTRQQLLDKAADIDSRFGSQFMPAVGKCFE